jgi:hypothetical protein
MTRFILPLLLFIPVVCHGQSNSTKEASAPTVAESSNIALASVATPSASNAPINAVKPAFKSIVPPKLVHTIPMKDDGNQHVHIEGRQRVVTVYLKVNEFGEPMDLHIPVPVDDALDVEVLATVGKFRYQPGTLNGKPIPMDVHMHYVVPVGAIY